MIRERALKAVLVIAGLLFVALLYPGVMFFKREPGVAMIMSLYVTLGIFLLLAVGNPAAHRSLITYAGWANVVHASVMAVQLFTHVIDSTELIGVVGFGIIGIALIALAPGRMAPV